MLRYFFRTVGSWGFGKIVSLISPLRKFTLGLAIALWAGVLVFIIGLSMLWFFPMDVFGENILDVIGFIIGSISGAIAYAAFKVKNFQDKKVEELSDLGHQTFSKVYASVKEKMNRSKAQKITDSKIEAETIEAEDT